MISKILTKSVKLRYSIAEIRNHRWYKKYASSNKNLTSGFLTSPIAPKRRRTTSSSQPVQSSEDVQSLEDLSQPLKSFSQPSCIDHMVVNTQVASQYSQSVGKDYHHICQRLVKRMTRFFTKLPVEEACKHLTEMLQKMNYNVTRNASNVVSFYLW